MTTLHRAVLRTDVSPDDITRIGSLVTATGFFRSDEIDIARELVEERLARGAASGYHFALLDVETELAAYACFGPVPCTVNRFDLYWIAVHPCFQRCGLGRRVLLAAEQQIGQMGGKRIYVETSSRPLYLPTRSFYLACNYVLTAIVPDFYDDGDDKHIYLKMNGEPL